ncbi:MAG: hypothetical protein J0I06_26520 [Planctomycetes bacterium]|nr:hypothetical protein [Planctomycetota bacterium]
MRSKLVGAAAQLAGYALVFLSLGIVAAVFFAAGFFPAVPLWAFIAGAVALAAPLMLAGGRLHNRGRVLLGTPAERVEAEHREGTAAFARYLLLVLLMGLWCAAPLFVRGVGLANPNDRVVALWFGGWMLAFTVGARWTTVPLWQAVERRFPTRRPEEPQQQSRKWQRPPPS